MVMIRPRGGDFVFDEDEVQLMIHDIAAARSAGAAGVVIGMLLPDGHIDTINCRRLVAAARPMQVTFHRAFDHAADPVSALEQVISLGADWLLTSGQAQGAEAGIPLLRQLVVQARGRIQLMAGAGISPRNAALIRSATGVQALHASARKPHPSPMSFRREGVPMGLPGLDAWQRMETDPDLVRAIRAAAVSTAPY
jgi:copper homeostasis protein